MREGAVDKVTALIVRKGTDGPEVVVFDHPHAGTQLPAGTMLTGESPAAAALREGWEETGIPGLRVVDIVESRVEATPGCGHGRLALDCVVGTTPFTRGHGATLLERSEQGLLVEVVGERGWIDPSAYCDDVVRHILQLESDAPTAETWWVITPDGGGLCWRCRWVPVHGDNGLVDTQADWLSSTRGRLTSPNATPPTFAIPDHPLCNATSHLQFWAFAGIEKRFVVSWIEPHVPVDDSLIRRALAACTTRDGLAVLISGDGRTMWNFPGGGREPDEDIEETIVREISEEACADVDQLQLIGYQHLLHLDDADRVVDEELQARYAAIVELRPWVQEFEIGARRLVTWRDATSVLTTWWQPQMLDSILSGAPKPWAMQRAPAIPPPS